MTSKRTLQHLELAKAYIGKGEGFYRKAAAEIVAAMDEDSSLTQREVARQVGKSNHYVAALIKAHGKGTSHDEEFVVDWGNNVPRNVKGAKKFLRDGDPEEIAELFDTPAIRRNVERAIVHAQQREPITSRPVPTGPSFIDLVVRVNSALIELESMVGNWRRPKELPPEFSAASFDDIAEKAMRIKDHVNALRSADNDEFQKIVRAFRDNTDA